MENSDHAFSRKHFTPACFSEFLSDREAFHGSFFNLHNICVGLLFAVTDKRCGFKIVLRKKSYKKSYRQVTETDRLQ